MKDAFALTKSLTNVTRSRDVCCLMIPVWSMVWPFVRANPTNLKSRSLSAVTSNAEEAHLMGFRWVCVRWSILLQYICINSFSHALLPTLLTPTRPVDFEHISRAGTCTSIEKNGHRRELFWGPLEQPSIMIQLVSLLVTTGNVDVADTNNETVESSNYDESAASWKKVSNDLGTLKLERDEVVRILDANTVKMKRSGLVSFAAVQTPSASNKFRFPDCMEKSPSSKVRMVLRAGQKVGIRFVEDAGGSRPRAALVFRDDGAFVNGELVRSGFARPVSRGRDVSERLVPGLTESLAFLYRDAQDRGIGMHLVCKEIEGTMIAADDQFEPLEATLQTRWGSDGGQPFIQQKDAPKVKPSNPGDKRGCSDFETYEDALRWYEKYAPYYGDVAKLDRNNDGIPCPGLAHTTNQDMYRMKVPSRQSASSQ